LWVKSNKEHRRKEMLERTFGVRLEDKQYRDRAGVYAVIFDNKGNTATVRTPKGNFLIGGGIDAGETHEECLKRECMEETGFDIGIREFVCKGDTYFYVEPRGRYVRLIGYFYVAELKEKLCKPVEEDHIFEWIPVEGMEPKMAMEQQAWAVKEAMRLRRE
jgi:8-oxo-dGTP diphosphatase